MILKEREIDIKILIEKILEKNSEEIMKTLKNVYDDKAACF